MKNPFVSKRRIRKDLNLAMRMRELLDEKRPYQSAYFDGQIKALKKLL